jgi:hypothetical protein
LQQSLNQPPPPPPGKKIKAQQMGVVWADFMTTLIVLVTTSKKYGY